MNASSLCKKIPLDVKIGAAVVLVAVGCYFAGRHSQPTVVTTTKTDTKVVQHVDSQKTEVAQTQTQSDTEVVAKENVQTNRDVDCTEKFDPTTGKLIERHCKSQTQRDVKQVEKADTKVSQATSDVKTDHTVTDTKTETKKVTRTSINSNLRHGSNDGKWDVTVGVSGTMDLKTMKLSESFGATLGTSLWGPFGASVGVDSTKTVTLSLDMDFHNFSISADVGSSFLNLSPFYGGSVGHRIIGPVWLSAFAYSNGTAGLGASVRAF